MPANRLRSVGMLRGGSVVLLVKGDKTGVICGKRKKVHGCNGGHDGG